METAREIEILLNKLKITFALYTMGKQFNCNICDKSFQSNLLLKGHLKNVHLSKKYVCNLCDKVFARKGHLNYHLKQAHEENGKSHKCNFCEKSFATPGMVKSHIDLIHGEKRNFECDKCDKDFKSRWALEYHVSNSHRMLEMNYASCKVCEKKFKNKESF